MSHAELSFQSGEASLSVREFVVREAMSTCFEARVRARSPHDDLDLDALVGRAASLVLAIGGATRTFRGICVTAEQLRSEERGLSTYEIVIAPSFAMLGYKKGYRVLQHLSLPDMAARVLEGWGLRIERRIDLASYPVVEVRTQYGESDLAFVSRLLEEAGIAFTFATERADGPDLVLEDAAHLGEPRALAHIDAPTGSEGAPFVTSLRVGRTLRSGRVTLRDGHFRIPPKVQLVSGGQQPEGALAHHAYLPGASIGDVEGAFDTPLADAFGASRPLVRVLDEVAARLSDAERVRARHAAFETTAFDLRPGLSFRVEGHTRRELAKEKLLVVELTTTGSSNASWKAVGRALFADVPYRPLRSTPRPLANGIQTAVVVGPENETIHTDEFGRVRVQFPWDGEGRFDDASSCWLRVSQSWAGGGHAHFALPRIGDEVVVGFVAADPDQPVVIGRLHNAAAPTPYRLPESKSVSTWRSASLAGTGGYNEIKLDDAPGGEVIAVQAERDYVKLVKNDESVTVGQHRVAAIGATDDVTAAQRHSITIGETTSIVTTPSKIVFSTGEATLTLEGPNVTLDAPGDLVLRAAGRVRVESTASDVIVQGGPYVRINPRGAGEDPNVGAVVPFEFPQGEDAYTFDDAVMAAASDPWFDPENPTRFDDATAPGGPLDPTPRGDGHDGYRAFKYAVVGSAIGMPRSALLRHAGAMNVARNGTSAGQGEPGNGVFGGEAPYGNSPESYEAMQKGFAFHAAQNT